MTNKKTDCNNEEAVKELAEIMCKSDGCAEKSIRFCRSIPMSGCMKEQRRLAKDILSSGYNKKNIKLTAISQDKIDPFVHRQKNSYGDITITECEVDIPGLLLAQLAHNLKEIGE
jgi:hypothetical protein